MHIKEMSLEGFKSYATRTVVSGFDEHFNAITGLNGSGKSNILDGICFVLGISNLQQVRAHSLQELVYKQGQAGVTKATVSLVFDNSDPSRSPLGYEDCPEITVTRQIVVGGRNKYLINGHLAQPSRVQTLFHSVQLNVNNPHFLIMQGRITKVLNMKPPEILSMLEEAAGTRMYEMKKGDALKTLAKKQSKVDEIDKLLGQEILPALEKLRKERMQYMKWANGNAELDRLKRFCIAFEYVQAERVRDSAVDRLSQNKAQIANLDNNNEILRTEIREMEKSIAALTAEKEARVGDELEVLSKRVHELSCSLVKQTSIMSNQEESLATEQKSAEKILKSIEDIKRSIEDKDCGIKKSEDGTADLRKRVEDLSINLDSCEREYQGVLAGKSNGDEEKCLEDKLRDAKAAVGAAESELNQLKTTISHSEKELKEKKAQLTTKLDEAAAMENELNARTKDLEAIKAEMASVTYIDGQMETLQKERSVELEVIQKLRDKVRILSGKLANVQFTYRDPEKNFDRSKVKGVVARLFKVKDDSALTALEITAGHKLYNVVVDNEETSKQLLQNGALSRRVTIIPLSRIQSRVVSSGVQSAAIKLVGEGNAKLALSLIECDPAVQNAMDYVFGSTFICSNNSAAEKVAFELKVPCVTLDGDKFEPAGFLTGGSHRNGGELLKQLQEFADAESELSVYQRRLAGIEDKISQILPHQRKFQELNSKFEIKSHELSLFQSRAQQTEHHKLGQLVKKLEHELEEAKLEANAKRLFYEKSVDIVSELEKSIRDQGNQREIRLKNLGKKIKTLKAELHSASKQLKVHESEMQKLVMEKEAVVQELNVLENQFSSLESHIQKIREVLERHRDEVTVIKNKYDQAESELQISRSKMKECDSQITSIAKEQQKLQQKLSDANVERKKLENEVRHMEVEQKDCSLKVDKLLEKHGWIATEKHLFGKSGTDYDFSSRNPSKSKEELEKLQAEQQSLEKRINKKVMVMFEKAEDEYNDLLRRKSIIENDKLKIKEVIEELDERKKEALQITWVKVNKDFGSIFSTLLPGTMAKLEPPEGCSFLDGLEVRVAFGSVWKQSLSELSGGQRSLLALSLILALLLFKPAPLYILDEVDAALDLSHTQNIGRMIKSHFPHSQFIVVSLKEGMFNNANVLFRTKFVDGVSTVTRTVPSKQR